MIKRVLAWFAVIFGVAINGEKLLTGGKINLPWIILNSYEKKTI